MRRFACLLVALVVVAALLGCQPRTDEAAGPEPGTAVPPVTGDASARPAGESYQIAVVPKGTVYSFWKTVKAGAEDACNEAGAEMLWKGPTEETDIARQIAIIENFITSQVDAIVMAACDADALVPKVKAAIEAGIPVITIDSGISSDDALAFVATDNVEGARQAAIKLAELIGERGKVGLIPFIQGAATSDMREEGFKQGIAGYPNIELVSTLYCQGDSEKAMKVTENMLTANEDLAGIFACNEPGAIGAAQVLKQRDLAGQVKLVAFDAADTEIEALNEGIIQALIVQDPYKMGYDGVKAAIDAIEGREVDDIDTGVVVVTPDNIEDEEIQKLLYPDIED